MCGQRADELLRVMPEYVALLGRHDVCKPCDREASRKHTELYAARAKQAEEDFRAWVLERAGRPPPRPRPWWHGLLPVEWQPSRW